MKRAQELKDLLVRIIFEDVRQLKQFLLVGNSPPTITGDGVFHVNVGEESIYTFQVNDTNDFNVTIEGGTPEGGVLSDDGNGMYTFSWTTEVIPSISGLSFVAMDSSGAATLHSPLVQVCACFNGGECTEEGVLSTDELVQTLTCLCTEGMAKSTYQYHPIHSVNALCSLFWRHLQ